METKLTQQPARRKRSPAEIVEINQPIARKPAKRETQSIFIAIVRERIARDWRRGVMTRDLAAKYRVSRPEIERIVHEEIFPRQGQGAA